MSNVKISDLTPASTPLSGSELVPIVQSGVGGLQTKQTTADDFTTLAIKTEPAFLQSGTGAVPTTVQTKLRETVSVMDFGAVGDGVADDTDAIQNAINAVAANSPVANGKQVGGVVWFPKGRYRITATLTGVTDGITIRGEPSGLDSVPLNQVSSGSQIFCDNGVTGFPMFTVNDGGPIIIQDIGLNGTQTVTNSTCILSGNGATNTGVTQAHFSNVRFTGFTTVIRAAKFFDVSFYDCGFEYNTTCFGLIGGTYTGLVDIKFVSCIFFGGSSAVFQLSTGAALDNVTFSACLFECDQTQTVNCDIFAVFDATLSNVSFSACNFKGYTGDNCIRTLSTSSSVKEISFSACNFKTTNALTLPYQSPTGAMYDIVFNACSFQNSNISAAYELTDFILANSIVRGTSTVSLSSCNNLTIIGNDFANASVNPPLAFTDIFNRVLVTNNIFADAVTSIPINASSTKVNISNNINGSITVSTTWTTVTAGSGGWTNNAVTPQFYKDQFGYVSLRGLVTNSSPSASTIMCSLPLGYRPEITQSFLVPNITNTGYVTVAASTDGNIYCIAVTGSGGNFDLSVIRLKTA